jgi:dTDP-D-glucose 4,6-dehydratase
VPQLTLLPCAPFLKTRSYVTDVAEAFDVILHKGTTGEVYNIGTNKERSVLQVATDICAHFKRDTTSSLEYVCDRLFNDRRCGRAARVRDSPMSRGHQLAD